MSKSEVIEYGGTRFRRYPESQDASLRNYFRPPIHIAMRGVESLHREIWKAERGPIPPGWHVHHIDGNPLNNSLDNLECLPEAEHLSHHGNQECSARKREHLDSIRHLAAAWHSSPEGIAWHKEHGRSTWETHEAEQRTCELCGVLYLTKARQTVKFCSNNCRSNARRRSGVDDVDRECRRCKKTFRVNQYSVKTFCGRLCAARHRVGK
jgi:hypothetical protein